MPHQCTYTLSCGGKSDAGRHVIVKRELKQENMIIKGFYIRIRTHVIYGKTHTGPLVQLFKDQLWQ